MSQGDFSRLEGESLEAWLARLEALDREGMSVHSLSVLEYRVAAARNAIRRRAVEGESQEGKSQEGQPQEAPDTEAPATESWGGDLSRTELYRPSDPLEVAKDAYRRLDQRQRQQFTDWLAQGAQ